MEKREREGGIVNGRAKEGKKGGGGQGAPGRERGGGEGGLTPVGGVSKWGDAGHVLHVHVGSKLGGVGAREGKREGPREGGREEEGREEGGRGGKEDE
jgi:hypothetical protein